MLDIKFMFVYAFCANIFHVKSFWGVADSQEWLWTSNPPASIFQVLGLWLLTVVFGFFIAGEQNQNFMRARQALYPQSYSPTVGLTFATELP